VATHAHAIAKRTPRAALLVSCVLFLCGSAEPTLEELRAELQATQQANAAKAKKLSDLEAESAALAARLSEIDTIKNLIAERAKLKGKDTELARSLRSAESELKALRQSISTERNSTTLPEQAVPAVASAEARAKQAAAVKPSAGPK
jgi:chromosome segregation ATPase